MPTVKTKGCGFAAVEIKECYSNSCDEAFVKENKKKINANLYSNSLQTGDSVHKRRVTADVTNGRIVRLEFYLKATDKSNQKNTFLLKGIAEKFSERGDSGSLVFSRTIVYSRPTLITLLWYTPITLYCTMMTKTTMLKIKTK